MAAHYIAESAKPIYWFLDGSNHYYHSEHIHSQYINLKLLVLVGLRPRSVDFIEINPLIPDNWKFTLPLIWCGTITVINFSILWDKDGEKYNKERGF